MRNVLITAGTIADVLLANSGWRTAFEVNMKIGENASGFAEVTSNRGMKENAYEEREQPSADATEMSIALASCSEMTYDKSQPMHRV